MAANIPAALKSIDISRFAMRAAQVEKAKPVMAYWCNYWIVNQILSKGLHTTDDESTTYTMGLMDKLEQTKAEHSREDAIIDDVAGQAYVEQFGLETFQRADNAVRANKATRQTADTFLAAATFLELSHIWGPLDPDIASKIKFAKYHALRIAKALKAGEDPNLSNPVSETPSEQQPPLDPNDPDVRAINGQEPAENGLTKFQPWVEEVPDEHDQLGPRLARSSTLDQSLHPSRAPSIPRSSGQNYSPAPSGAPSPQNPTAEDFYSGASHADVSPIAPSTSTAGGYFPNAPDGYNEPSQPVLPETPSNVPDFHESSSPAIPPPHTRSQPQIPSQLFPTQPGPTSEPWQTPSSPAHQQASQYSQYHAGPPSAPSDLSHPPYQVPQQSSSSQIPPRMPVHQAPVPRVNTQTAYRTDEESVAKAQKHARWAISALNFEDVNTAVKELMGALESLGAA
ncbi:hypothetical protein MMC30_000073 [Trapelia coarctata]|nr:hypothetical protein [Trapelia coarctata]